MCLKECYWDARNTRNEQIDQYKKPSTWTPCNGRDQALDCYINAWRAPSWKERTQAEGNYAPTSRRKKEWQLMS